MGEETTSGRRRKQRLLSPEQKWEISLEVTSGELTQADAARKWRVDTSVVINQLTRLDSNCFLRGFCPGRGGTTQLILQRRHQASRTDRTSRSYSYSGLLSIATPRSWIAPSSSPRLARERPREENASTWLGLRLITSVKSSIVMRPRHSPSAV